MTLRVCGHTVKRKVRGESLWYECVECGHNGEAVAEFDQHGCPPQ